MPGQRVQDHYARPGSGTAIAARVIAALRAFAGAHVAITRRRWRRSTTFTVAGIWRRRN